MAKISPPSETLSNKFRKNDLFLLVLLTASLALNVYLGWSVKSLRAASAATQPSPINRPTGMTVGPFTATRLGGGAETVGYGGDGKPTVFYVFAPSCAWCEQNTESINTLAGQKGDSFRFVGLSLSNEEGLARYVEAHRFGFPVYKDLPPEAVKMLGLGSTPQTIIVSPDGLVLKNWAGAYVKPLQGQVEEFFGVRLPGIAAQKK